MYDLNKMGLPKVYEDDILMIFMVEQDDDEDSVDDEDTEDDESCDIKHKKEPYFPQRGISQFSMPVMSDRIEQLLLKIIGA